MIRKVVLQVHLYLGLIAGLFLIVLGLTGSIMAFEGDIDHWLHPGMWYIAAGGQPLPEGQLIAGVEHRFAPARVAVVQMSQHRDLAQLMLLTDRLGVTVNPYTGAALGRRIVPTRTDRWIEAIHQVHLRLAGNIGAPWAGAGKVAVNYAGLALFLLAPTGLVLWWRTKRTSIHWTASWFRIFFDTHRVIGIYAGLFLWIAGFTGVLIGFDWGEKMIYAVTHSERPNVGRPQTSTPVPGASPIGMDRAIGVAKAAISNAALEMLFLPQKPEDAYEVIFHVPGQTSSSADSSAVVDQFSGQALAVRNFLKDSQGYRWIRFNRSIHTGDIGGLAGHIVMSLSSLLLVAMVITGVVIRLKKLAV